MNNQHNCDNYLRISINTKANPQRTIETRAFIDNGNTTFAGAVISKSLAQKLGVKYIKSNTGKIKDVSGKTINNLGRCEKLNFKVAEIN